MLWTTTLHDLVFIFTQQIGKERDAVAVMGIKKEKCSLKKKLGNWL